MVTMIIYKDQLFNFYEFFNENNGTLIRTDINGVDPTMRSFPELLDVGIMGHCDSGEHCKKAGIDCYQNGQSIQKPHMSLDDFEMIVRQATGRVFQIALGGAGDPNKHPAFGEMLKICRYHHIIPNLTTSGFHLQESEVELIQKYCGAVAVSWYSRLNDSGESNRDTLVAADTFIKAGCCTNIHFVISKYSVDEAIIRLKNDLFPVGINAVIFILYKPIGNGLKRKVISKADARLEEFFSLVTERKHPYRIGFDTCFTPAILKFRKDIPRASIDACEAATFSMYIDSQLNCFPCSFGLWDSSLSESLYDKTLTEIWFGEKFSSFRLRSKSRCTKCGQRITCRNGCRLGIEIDLC